MPEDRLTFVCQSGVADANVIFIYPDDTSATECRCLRSDSGPAHEEGVAPPPGWRLRSDIRARASRDRLRDGDILVPTTESLGGIGLAAASLALRCHVLVLALVFGELIWTALGMVAPPIEQQELAPVSVGKYPWRVPPPMRVCHEFVNGPTPARLLSPFTDVSEETEITRTRTLRTFN